jgi:ferredoxin-NADP reductase
MMEREPGRPGVNDPRGRDYDADGHLDLALIERLGPPQGADFCLCGPAEFLEDMRSGLQRWGIAPKSLARPRR